MRTVLLTLMSLVTGLTVASPQVQAQFVFGQPVSGQATPFNSLFVLPTPSTSASFFPPTGFYHYFWLPQYSAVSQQLYTDFQYDLPPGKVTYEFTVLQGFEY